jgi:hypothetical protein
MLAAGLREGKAADTTLFDSMLTDLAEFPATLHHPNALTSSAR